ncbi:hypothetical protein OPT61_g7268 [Boeremia exigua]|uniref:Uncharacterized protein n=1 Tax=Boeremia exigua TaxID=749465 RepID=A0ACC2I2X5_9PLEO|nr:hypothetical protein OPT61_g7268 [Boeremia exigua]
MSSTNDEDPFLQVQADVLSALNTSRPLFKSYLRIRSSASSANSPELREARQELEQTLQDLGQDLEDLVESVKAVEHDPYKFGLEIDEVERRRRLVKEVGDEIENMHEALQQTVQDAQKKGNVLPDPDSFEEDEDNYAQFEQEQQMQIMHDQDEALDGVFRTVGNLRMQADDMGRELEEQGEMLKDVDTVADRVGGKLQTGMKKVGSIIRKNEVVELLYCTPHLRPHSASGAASHSLSEGSTSPFQETADASCDAIPIVNGCNQSRSKLLGFAMHITRLDQELLERNRTSAADSPGPHRLSRISDKSFQEPVAEGTQPVAFKISTPAPHRQLSLLTITIILNTLLWSSAVCTVIALFQIASDSQDHTNIPPGVLTLVSAIVTIAYTIVHTTYSVKQRALTYQQLDLATIKKTTYIANRLVVTLCVLWLLTAGWNMILVARRPICLPNQLDGESWEAGITCLISRVGMALAMIALVASLTLFGMMAAVRRPFEAHLFAYGQRSPDNTEPTPPASRRPSEDHAATEKLVSDSGMRGYSHARRMSNLTNADVETLDLNAGSRPASIIQPPSPTHNRIEFFTSPLIPPPLPPMLFVPVDSSPLLTSHIPTLDPFAHRRRLSLTPRTDALLAPAAYVPNSIPIEFSASAQRAVYPDATHGQLLQSTPLLALIRIAFAPAPPQLPAVTESRMQLSQRHPQFLRRHLREEREPQFQVRCW